MARSERELAPYEDDLEVFESGKPYDQPRIQARFTALLNSFIDRNVSDHPVYLTADILQTEPQVATGYKKVPQGLAVRLFKDGIAPPKLKPRFDLDRFIESRTNSDDEMQRGISNITAGWIELASRSAAQTGDLGEASRLRELAKRLR
jgi:hypothetical protein